MSLLIRYYMFKSRFAHSHLICLLPPQSAQHKVILLTIPPQVLRDGDQIPFYIKPITRGIVGKVETMFFFPNIKMNFEFLEEQLATSGGDYLCGAKLTAADILMSFPLLACRTGGIGIDMSVYPKLQAYIARIENLESYKRSIRIAEEKTGEKYEIL